jgi:ABC-type polysaccharide/polyol phosphate transport system ATPase subunit
MSSRPIISVRGLGKKYVLGKSLRHDTFRDSLAGLVRGALRRRPLPESRQRAEEFWALKDVSFDVQEGEVLGIIGRNGAGKSTLLKVLSRITEPTTGEIRTRGRVASLLEVGTGFHPELTGRENVFLNGAILGMRQAEIRAKFDEIVAFSGVERFLDTPVKRYSSGMYVRLAFAVAAHLDPEILIVDEVLAVGDMQFQEKCLAKMEDVAKCQGRTVLFVSHNLSAVSRLCQTGLCLAAGRVNAGGTAAAVIDAYHRSVEPTPETAARPRELCDGEARVVDWALSGGTHTGDSHMCRTRDTCEFIFAVASNAEARDAFFGLVIWDGEGRIVIAGNSRDNGQGLLTLPRAALNLRVTVRLPLKAGLYQLDVSINSQSLGQLERCFMPRKLHVLPSETSNLGEAWQGLVTEEPVFHIDGGDPSC